MSETLIESGLLYTKEHEWVQLDEHIATIGITDHAQQALGDLVFVELPNVDETLSQGDTPVVVESYKAASDVYAPISGKILEVNEALRDAPELVNQSPYESGWLIKLESHVASELEELMDADAYRAYLLELEE